LEHQTVAGTQEQSAATPFSHSETPAPVITTARAWGRAGIVVLGLLILACGGMLTWLSIARYRGYNAGMLDLGNMAQAIASVLRGEPLVFTYKDGPMSRLALHVELFYYLLVPLYALWSDPQVLLVFQAALFALGAVPVARLTLRRTGSPFFACGLALVYLLYPTAMTSVIFDFHGDTLAMPLLLFALDALDRRAWWQYALFIGLALSSKVYVALPVALLGPVIWWCYRERRVALLTGLAGLVYGAVAFLVVRPLFTTGQTSEAHRGLNYLSFYFGQFQQLFASLDQRLISAIIVFGPALFLIRSGWRWLLPGLPIAAAALLSTGPGSAYDFRYHHYAVVVPFIMMAAIMSLAPAGTRRVPRARRKRFVFPDRFAVVVTLMTVIVFAASLVDIPLNPRFWSGVPGSGLQEWVYGRTARDALKDRWLAAVVPAGAPLATSTFLAPHLVNRHTLYLVRYPDEPSALRLPDYLPQIDYAVPDALFDYAVPLGSGFAGGVAYDLSAITQLLKSPDFGLVAAEDGLLLFQRNPPPDQVLEQQAEPVHVEQTATPQMRFGEDIGLIRSAVEPLSGRRFRLTYDWVALRPLSEQAPLVAVSRIEGQTGNRVVHLPTYALLPTTEWEPGQVIREQFDVELPADLAPGTYQWRTGWYTTDSMFAANTDERSRIGDEASMAIEVR
jgi:uncharacterized membrane protein